MQIEFHQVGASLDYGPGGIYFNTSDSALIATPPRAINHILNQHDLPAYCSIPACAPTAGLVIDKDGEPFGTYRSFISWSEAPTKAT